jgi:hypothetical protein
LVFKNACEEEEEGRKKKHLSAIYLFGLFIHLFAKIHTMATKENPVQRVQRILFYFILFDLPIFGVENRNQKSPHHVEGKNKGV